MKYFIMSDIHIDFYIPVSKKYEDLLESFEKIYQKKFLPADNLIIAGDIANDYYNHVNFLKFISTKYSKVYVVFGNHDFGINSTFGNGNPVKYSEDRLEKTKENFKNTNVYILDGNVIDNIGGTMGMCDFHYETMLDLGIAYKIKQWQKHWYDGRVWHIKTPEWHSGYLMNPIAILQHEKNKINKIIEENPNIIITHFCPIQMGIKREYENELTSAFFNFDAKSFFDKLTKDTIWICGHTHDSWLVDYINSNGIKIKIICNPMGYPNENPLYYNNLKKENFLVEL